MKWSLYEKLIIWYSASTGSALMQSRHFWICSSWLPWMWSHQTWIWILQIGRNWRQSWGWLRIWQVCTKLMLNTKSLTPKKKTRKLNRPDFSLRIKTQDFFLLQPPSITRSSHTTFNLIHINFFSTFIMVQVQKEKREATKEEANCRDSSKATVPKWVISRPQRGYTIWRRTATSKLG